MSLLKSSPFSGFSPLYQEGKWSWSPCIIRGYDRKEKKYEVEFVETGRRKKVQRLSLRFDTEDEQAFKARLERCERQVPVL